MQAPVVFPTWTSKLESNLVPEVNLKNILIMPYEGNQPGKQSLFIFIQRSIINIYELEDWETVS